LIATCLATAVSSSAVAATPGTHPCGHAQLKLLVPHDVPHWNGPVGHGRGFPTVGDVRDFWTYDLSVMPPKNVQVAATCRAVGARAAVWIGDNVWDKAVKQADVDALLAALETATPRMPNSGLVENNAQLFGDPPHFAEGDPDLTLLVYDIPSYKGYSFDGFFRSEDFQPFNPACKTNPMLYCSNELGMIHVDSAGIGGDYMHGVVAHEFEHLIHFGADEGEEPWIDESLAELAMVFSGYEDPGNLADFAAHPNQPLITPPPVSYGACLLFGSYLYQRIGEEGIRDLVGSTANGIPTIEAVLPEGTDFPGFFSQWTAANVLDDPAVGDGLYGYELVDVPPFATTAMSELPSNKEFSVPAAAGLYLETDGVADASMGLDVVMSGAPQDVGMHLVSESASEVAAASIKGAAHLEPPASSGTLVIVLSNPDTGNASATLTATPVEATTLPDSVESSPESAEETDVVQDDSAVSEDVSGEGDSAEGGDSAVSDSVVADVPDNASDAAADAVADDGAASGGSSGCAVGTRNGSACALLVALMLVVFCVARFRGTRRA